MKKIQVKHTGDLEWFYIKCNFKMYIKYENSLSRFEIEFTKIFFV